MSEQTENLSLPYIMAAQAQKHVTHNESLRMLDSLVQISVLDRHLSNPPVAPENGQRYIIGPSATGDWLGREGQLAAYQDGAWTIFEPKIGWIVWIEDEAGQVVFDGSDWVLSESESAAKLGINASADTTNKLTVNSDAVLFNHNGNGVQVKLNKNATSDTASILYQTAFSGRAEFGTSGDDKFHVKVSPDGAAWKEAIVIDETTGQVSMPQTPTFVFMLVVRYYCYSDLRWVTSSDDEFSTSDKNASESAGTNTDPYVDWRHVGQYLKKGTRIMSISQIGKGSSTEVTDLEMYYLAKYPTSTSRWETGIDHDSEVTFDLIHRDNFLTPSKGGTVFGGNIIDMHRREIDLDFVMPEDGFFSCYVKPKKKLDTTRYFASTLTVECSL